MNANPLIGHTAIVNHADGARVYRIVAAITPDTYLVEVESPDGIPKGRRVMPLRDMTRWWFDAPVPVETKSPWAGRFTPE